MKKAYITGPTGAIGLALIDKLNSEGINVTVFVRPDSERAERLIAEGAFSNVKVVKCDLSGLKDLSTASGLVADLNSDESVFYHLGWMGTSGESRMDMRLQLKNIEYTIDAVELAGRLNCKRFVGVGSQAEYGRTPLDLNSYSSCNPENGYGVAKLAAGKMSLIRAKQLGLEHVWTRVLSVYGKGDNENTLIASLISNLCRGESAHCTKGEQIWNYINSKDAAEFLRRLGDAEGADGNTYLIAGTEKHILRKYMETVRKIVAEETNDRSVRIMYDKPYPEGQVMHLSADISETVAVTGYTPQIQFEDGIRELVKTKLNGK